ncbi:MAG: carbohydrate ABC transporter substrate-binding protein, partial [Burkholderiales bacterium]|nr:carbohydrate ABC transporter substrate-binding protein [Burkholderiales bacterium]
MWLFEVVAELKRTGGFSRAVLISVLLFSCSSATVYCATQAQETPLQILHWWTSASERKAANLLSNKLAEEGIVWRDAGIPGGAGIGAGKVLKSRVLASDAPEVTQIIGASIKEWADLGFLLELDKVANANKWQANFFPTVHSL